MADITLNITGMTCAHCQRAARAALADVAGVHSVTVTLEPGRAVLSGTPDPAALIAALHEEGFTAELSR